MHAEAEAEQVQLDDIADHPMVVAGRPELVTDVAGLESIAAHVREVGSFAYDTEFIGEETFHPRICLVQIATAERLVLIDPVEVPDLSPIFDVVADPAVETSSTTKAGPRTGSTAHRPTASSITGLRLFDMPCRASRQAHDRWSPTVQGAHVHRLGCSPRRSADPLRRGRPLLPPHGAG